MFLRSKPEFREEYQYFNPQPLLLSTALQKVANHKILVSRFVYRKFMVPGLHVVVIDIKGLPLFFRDIIPHILHTLCVSLWPHL